MTNSNKVKLAPTPQAEKQAGIVMLITLIALVIMLLASIALIRSTDTNLLVSGHLSFKRDVVNQAERPVPVIKQLFSTTSTPVGVLSTAVSRQQDIVASNYFATIQASNAFGIPTALLDTSSAVYTNAATTISGGTGTGVTIRYMIDRMCLTAGAANTTSCSISKSSSDPTGQNKQSSGKPAGIDTPIYRISIRATGPRNTEAYIQSTFTVQ